MIQLKNVIKTYGNRNVVNDITFSINTGEIFGFLGPNGAGKTTTIKMVVGLLQPTSGEIWIGENNVLTDKKKIYQDIGVVFELPNLYMKASIKKNLKIFAELYHLHRSRVYEVMEDLQLLDKQKVKVEKLSKGWKQRVLIARALLHKPKVLILDEPTSGLDPNTAALIRNYIKQLNEGGTTIIITTHDMHEADELSHRVGIMNNGEMIAIGKPMELKDMYLKKEIRVEYMEEGNVIAKCLEIGIPETEELITQLNIQGRLISMNRSENSLAEVFAVLTGGQLS